MKRTTTIVSLILVALYIVGAFVIYLSFDEWTERGQFGDMFGSVNALFSSFALGGVIIAILIQKKDLELQREELKATREEMKRSTQAQEESAKALAVQIKNQVIASRINGLSALLNSVDMQLQSIEAHNRLYEDLTRRPPYNERNVNFKKMSKQSIVSSRSALRKDLRKLMAEAGQTFTEDVNLVL